MAKIRLGIVGYGNLSRASIDNLKNFNDIELVAVFSRRELKDTEGIKFSTIDKILEFKDKIDVMLMCGGSKDDLPKQSPEIAKNFNIVDSFDTHANVDSHFLNVDKVSKDNQTVGLISGGWDPGVFSLARSFFDSVLPNGETYTFWGKGVSQGHSDALRRVDGVKLAVQYTIPKQDAIDKVKSGENPKLTTKEKHLRECFVVAEKNADIKKIEQEIKTMPNYFADYDTVVNFISEEEFKNSHTSMPHGGSVIRTGKLKEDISHTLELNIKLGSNPHFTSSVLLCYVRAVYKLAKEKKFGVYTVLDIPFSYLSNKTGAELRNSLV